jgi:hypothetical protein
MDEYGHPSLKIGEGRDDEGLKVKWMNAASQFLPVRLQRFGGHP